MIEDIKVARGFQGNHLLKRSGQAIEWTDEMIMEYAKCLEDPIYFIETYVQIINPNKGLQLFLLYDYQKEMIKSYKNNRFSITTTSRQAGKSTTSAAFLLWYVLFHAEKTVGLLANKGEMAREILGRVQLMYQYLPAWMQQGVGEWNKGTMKLENNSRIIATSTGKDAARGYTFNIILIDEAAFVDNWEEFNTSVLPTVSAGQESKIILISTPNGLNHFYAIWANAINGKNGYGNILVPWWEVPGRGEEWKKQTLESMNFDQQKFEQEYCCEFQGSSGTLIAGWKLKELVAQIPIHKKEGVTQYVEPLKDHKYMIVCDTSRGKGLDYSAFVVFDCSGMPYNQVCVFRSNATTPVDYASVIHRFAKAYNDAFVMVEVNDIGEHVSHSLMADFEYENILCTENGGRNGKKVTLGWGGGSVDKGVRTTKIIKSTGCSLLKLLVEQNQLIINDFDSISELSTFSRKGQSYEAESGKTDDIVMCLMLFAWLSEQQYFKDLTDISTLKNLRDMQEDELQAQFQTGFVLYADGLEDAPYDDGIEALNPDAWIWNSDYHDRF